MANWTTLKTAISSLIKTNGNREITGQLLQSTLNGIVDSVGAFATFVGIATPSTNPGVADGPVFYITATAGTYSNFNGIVVNNREFVILLWTNRTWNKLLITTFSTGSTIVQSTGTSTTATMSQKAITEAVNNVMAVHVDDVEQLQNDIGDIENAAGNAQITATEALNKVNDAISSPTVMHFNGFNVDDSGYTGDGISTQPALSVKFHTLYGHFEATVQTGSSQKTVRKWKGAEKFNSYDADGTPHTLPDRLFLYNNSLYISTTDELFEFASF